MKKLWLVLGCLAFAACGNTPKNPVMGTIPSPQVQETQKAFETRCAQGLRREDPPGELNANKTVCRSFAGAKSFASETPFDAGNEAGYQDFSLSRGQVLRPGFYIRGNFETNTIPPDVLVDNTREFSGTVPPTVVGRGGEVKLRLSSGTYKALSYQVFTCSGRGNDYVSCNEF